MLLGALPLTLRDFEGDPPKKTKCFLVFLSWSGRGGNPGILVRPVIKLFLDLGLESEPFLEYLFLELALKLLVGLVPESDSGGAHLLSDPLIAFPIVVDCPMYNTFHFDWNLAMVIASRCPWTSD